MASTDRQPWDRLDGERMWYERFDRYYRPMGPGRTVWGAYLTWWREQDPDREGKRPNGGTPQTWRDRANQFDWQGRADAWDRHVAREAHQAELDERIEDRRKRIQLLKGLRAKTARALENLDPEKASWFQVTRAVAVLSRELRVEYEGQEADLPIEEPWAPPPAPGEEPATGVAPAGAPKKGKYLIIEVEDDPDAQEPALGLEPDDQEHGGNGGPPTNGGKPE